MVRILYIAKVMDGLPETIITMMLIIIAGPIYEVMSFVVLFLASFFWVIRLKREIQQQFQNKPWRAIRSMFRKQNKYGKDGDEKY